MASDYKYRASQQRKTRDQRKVSGWKILLVLLFIGLFIGFLIFLNSSSPEKNPTQEAPAEVLKVEPEKKPEQPKFTFYKILPETEVFVPSHEIDTRNREEGFGKIKPTTYLIQIGSFNQYEKANSLKLDLAMMGIQSRVEKINLNNVIWNRLVIGPYSKSSNVAKLTKRLKENGVNTKVIEITKQVTIK